MCWLDYAIVCLLIWGGISGFLSGWRNVARSICVIILTVAAAVLFKADFAAVASQQLFIQEGISAVLSRNISIPVSAAVIPVSTFASDLGVPAAIFNGSVLSDPIDLRSFIGLLSNITTNTLSFAALTLLWVNAFYLIDMIVLNKRASCCVPERWVGVPLGVLRYAFLIFIITGVLAPFAWLMSVPGGILSLEDSVFLDLSLRIFSSCHIWM